MKGIILAGGSGTRLYPATHVVSKQLLPIYDKPLIYYPLSSLMLAGIRDVLIITRPDEAHHFERVLGDGSQWGMNIQYAVQPEPKGIAQAFLIGKEFIDGSPTTLVLGDNIFYGHGIPETLYRMTQSKKGATVLAYWVNDPERYGVLEFDQSGKAIGIQEKPDPAPSNWAVTGYYCYDERVVDIAENLKPSARGELEITDVNAWYLEKGDLAVEKLGRGYAWFDTGTHQSMLDACNFVALLEARQGMKLACVEEIAYHMGYISLEKLQEHAESLKKSGYGQYLLSVCSGQR
ncbi:glucose-1-phosphate thymidylyltransferase RfbA [Hwanghaeella sp.]|uniref:glucose-1-phosphate thymidylyltransferase RfbA n=1 Tax=Hwanghaeella sp. TaxID=2605943 RepID=UPI003CCB9513